MVHKTTISMLHACAFCVTQSPCSHYRNELINLWKQMAEHINYTPTQKHSWIFCNVFV